MGIELNNITEINVEDATGQITAKLNQLESTVNNTEANTNLILIEEDQTQAAIQDVQELLEDVDEEVDNINVDVANINANVVHVIQKTDPLPSDPASESVISGLINSVQDVVDAIKLVTDNLPNSGALTSIAQAANTALQATLLLVKDKTDNLPASPANETTLNNATYGLNALKNLIDTLQANIGDFQGQANLQSLLQVLGVPDTALKSLYTCLITDRLDNATYGLSSLKTLIGSTTDDETIDSIYGALYILKKHAHGETFLYPSGADALQITKASGIWAAFPTPTQIIAANAVTSPFDLHFIHITGISANGEYEVGIYEGAPGAETLRHLWPASRTSIQSQEGSNSTMTLYFAANTRISVALRGSPNAQESLRIKVVGHKY